MKKPEYGDRPALRSGPIRHATLPPQLVEQIRAVFEVMGPYLETTLEQFEVGFMREMFPEREVACWRSIVAAWLAYKRERPRVAAQPEKARKVLGALISISTGFDDVSKMPVPPKVGRRLLRLYYDPHGDNLVS
jgi:hypothetical protein